MSQLHRPASASRVRVHTGVVGRPLLLTVLGSLPIFLSGALSAQIGRDFDLGPAALGVAAAMFFVSAGLLAAPCGRVVQWLELPHAWRVSLLASAMSLTALATASSYAALLVGLVLGGAANAMVHPTANQLISQTASGTGLGLAFGLKQGAVPAATLMAGLAVPAIALTVGWRWAFAMGALAAGIAAAHRTGAWQPRREAARGSLHHGSVSNASLVLLTVGAGFGSAASTGMAVFFIGSGPRAGISVGASGLLFALCSLLVLVTRVALGWLVDQRPGIRAYVLVARLMTGGSLGYVLLAWGHPLLFVIGAFISCGLGWTWTGTFECGIVRDHPQSAARTSGQVQTGLLLGAGSGPLIFGVLAVYHSGSIAWLAMGALSLVAGLLTFLASGSELTDHEVGR